MYAMKMIRLSNRPAKLARHDSKTIVSTAGLYAVHIDTYLKKIKLSYTQPPSHVVGAVMVKSTLVTAHTDYGIMEWLKDGKFISLLDNTEQRAQGDVVWYASPSKALPMHTSPIVSLLSNPTITAATSLDEDGRIIVWSIQTN